MRFSEEDHDIRQGYKPARPNTGQKRPHRKVQPTGQNCPHDEDNADNNEDKTGSQAGQECPHNEDTLGGDSGQSRPTNSLEQSPNRLEQSRTQNENQNENEKEHAIRRDKEEAVASQLRLKYPNGMEIVESAIAHAYVEPGRIARWAQERFDNGSSGTELRKAIERCDDPIKPDSLDPILRAIERGSNPSERVRSRTDDVVLPGEVF